MGRDALRGERRRLDRPRAALAALAVACIPAAGSADVAQAAAPTGVASWFDPSTAPFIPIPEIDTAPHSGVTLGVIPTVLYNNERGELNQIIAPDLIHSQYFGWGSRMRAMEYPSDDTQWSVVGGLKQRVEREFDALYTTGLARTESYSWSLEAIYDRSGIPRFYGLGNDSSRLNESTYVNNQGRIDALLGRNFTPRLQLAYAIRLREIDVLPGVLAGLRSIGAVFPGLNGIGTSREVDQRLMVSYDSRDSLTVPRTGGRLVLYGGFASRSFGSSFADTSVGADLRRYWRLDENNTLAWHTAVRYMPSARGAPFWALSSLGGDRSVIGEREPLRAYGEDRFIDRDLLSSGVELRTRVANFDAFGTRLSLEFAPFLDVGKVYSTPDGPLWSDLHRGGGLGIRGIASPFVVGYVDIGYGHEKAAVFSGISYPF